MTSSQVLPWSNLCLFDFASELRRESTPVMEEIAAVLASERLNTSGCGASAPQAHNQTPEGRARNHRVEFLRQ
jgi:hypothetical protein